MELSYRTIESLKTRLHHEGDRQAVELLGKMTVLLKEAGLILSDVYNNCEEAPKGTRVCLQALAQAVFPSRRAP